MVEQRSNRVETDDGSRVEYLMGALKGLSHEPSAALRDRLELLSSQRLVSGGEFDKRTDRAKIELLPWLRPAFVVALLAAAGIVGALVFHVRHPEQKRTGIEARVAAPPVAPANVALNSNAHAVQVAREPEAKLSMMHHPVPRLVKSAPSQQMIVRLPYSDSEIDTGTDATIRVSMSQAELESLGFPINAALHDRRVVAELTLGDDGLPRAISVPIPIEVIREKK